MSGSFMDSNVLIYTFDKSDPRKQKLSQSLVNNAIRTGDTIISYQIVQETLNVLVQKLADQVTREQVSMFFDNTLKPLCRINSSIEFYEQALHIKYRYHYRFYDSLIIATALDYGCATLYSEDMQDGQTIERLTIRNPFRN